MTWKRIDSDGKPRYIKRSGSNVFLSRDKDGALDDIPEGWLVIKGKNGRLKIIPEKN